MFIISEKYSLIVLAARSVLFSSFSVIFLTMLVSVLLSGYKMQPSEMRLIRTSKRKALWEDN